MTGGNFAAMPGRAPRRRLARAAIVSAASAVALVVSACGSSTTTSEPSGSFQVAVTRASFPARQRISANSDLVLAVKNTGNDALPQLTVTIWTGAGGVASSKAQNSFALLTHPIWLTVKGFPRVLGHGASAGADDSATDSYVFGALAPGQTKAMVWRVAPVSAGAYTIHYAVAAGPQGDAKAVTSGGAVVTGDFRVRIASGARGA